jgi:Zn-dependent metalloprotease
LKLTENKDGGSSSGTGDSAKAGEGAKNKTAKMSMDQALALLEELKQENAKKDQMITDLTVQLKEANDVLESQEKAKLIGEIMPRSTFKMDDLVGKNLEELKSIKATLD